MKNKIAIFAAYFAKVYFITIVSVVFFIATNTALYAAKIGYQIPAVCCTSIVSKCTLASSGGDSLSYLLNFSFAMPKYNENYSNGNNSTVTVTPDCESVNPSEKQFDFSKFSEYLTDVTSPDELINSLQEIRTRYLELSLYALMKFAGMEPLEVYPHENIQNQICQLADLISLIKTISKIQQS